MTRRRSKAEIAGLALFCFCLFVFVCVDFGMIYMAIHERWAPQMWARMLLFLTVITWGAYMPVRRRLKPTSQNAS
jgi:hypothetical protein